MKALKKEIQINIITYGDEYLLLHLLHKWYICNVELEFEKMYIFVYKFELVWSTYEGGTLNNFSNILVSLSSSNMYYEASHRDLECIKSFSILPKVIFG